MVETTVVVEEGKGGDGGGGGEGEGGGVDDQGNKVVVVAEIPIPALREIVAVSPKIATALWIEALVEASAVKGERLTAPAVGVCAPTLGVGGAGVPLRAALAVRAGEREGRGAVAEAAGETLSLRDAEPLRETLGEALPLRDGKPLRDALGG
jgi:hypothetical protein